MESLQPPSDAPTNATRAELVAGSLLVTLLALTLGLGAMDAWKKKEDLRPLQSGMPAPQFTLPTPDGHGTVALASFKGRVVLLDFWATWCPPCMREMPELAKLHTELEPRGFTVVGVNREPEDPARVNNFLGKHGILFPVGVDNAGVGESFRVMNLPTTVLIGRDGNVIRQFLGYTAPDVMRAAVLEALGNG